MNDFRKQETRFAENLRAQMARLRISQTDLAARVGVHQPTVALWCANRREPSLGVLVAVADELGVTVDWLLR